MNGREKKMIGEEETPLEVFVRTGTELIIGHINNKQD